MIIMMDRFLDSNFTRFLSIHLNKITIKTAKYHRLIIKKVSYPWSLPQKVGNKVWKRGQILHFSTGSPKSNYTTN